MCGSMPDIQSPTAEIRRGKKKEGKKKNKRQDENIYMNLYSSSANDSKNRRDRDDISDT